MLTYRATLSLLALAAIVMVNTVTAVSPEILPQPKPNLNCGPNEAVLCLPCGGDSCSIISHPPKMMCTAICKYACVCKKGHYRQNKKCVPAEECKVTCPKNMIFNPSAPAPRTCKTPRNPGNKEERTARCVCKPGLIQESEESRTCIRPSECKKNKPN